MTSQGLSVPAFAEEQEDQVSAVRRGGDPAAIIAAATAAEAAIRARVAQEPRPSPDDERAALIRVKRMLYNAAADCWPGWAPPDGPHASAADLEAALGLARSSADLVDTLALGAMQEGTARWLIGAFELALGCFDDALASFAVAEERYHAAPARGLALLTQGYAALTYEVARRERPANVPDFDAVLTALVAGGFPDGDFFCDQLRTARGVFL